MSPLRAADDVEPSLILRPCSFDTFMAGPVGKITSNQVRTDDDHRATITQNSKNWKCSDVSPAETPIPSAATSEPPPQGEAVARKRDRWGCRRALGLAAPPRTPPRPPWGGRPSPCRG